MLVLVLVKQVECLPNVRIQLIVADLLCPAFVDRLSSRLQIERLVNIPTVQVGVISPTVCVIERPPRVRSDDKRVCDRIPSSIRIVTKSRKITVDLVGCRPVGSIPFSGSLPT